MSSFMGPDYKSNYFYLFLWKSIHPNMRLSLKISAFAMLLTLFCSCGGRRVEPLLTRQFPTVSPTAMIQDPNEIMEYMAMHFWDAFMEPAEGYRCDSLYISGVLKGDVEQNLANYIYILDGISLKSAQKSVHAIVEKMEACERADSASNIFESFVELGEKYLFNPNSPLRNEDYYSPFARRLSVSEFLDSASRDRFAHVAKMCSLNEVGTAAADFRFCDRYGKMHTLYGIDAPHTLLFFSNPGCASCMQIITELKENPYISAMISEKRLVVLNIYIDEDIQAWRDYMPVYPDEWYNGFDPDFVIRNDKIYNVRAIPSLYLLDSEKNVLMKDAVPEKLLNLLTQI